jgi:putative molybdopterin biosynthesis protein
VLDTPAVRLLRQALGSAAWNDALRARPGYAPAEHPGAVLSLVKALPWWTFRKPRPG